MVYICQNLLFDMKELFTPTAYAKSKGITRQAVYKQIREKKVKTHTVSGKIFVVVKTENKPIQETDGN